MAQLVSETLPGTNPAAADRLLDLGADSVLLIRLASRIEEAFGVQLDLQTLFDNPSIAELAQFCSQWEAR